MLRNVYQWWVVLALLPITVCTTTSSTYLLAPSYPTLTSFNIYSAPMLKFVVFISNPNLDTPKHVFLLKDFLGDVLVALLDALRIGQIAESKYIDTSWRTVSLYPLIPTPNCNA